MLKYEFTGSLKEYLNSFLLEKRAVGYIYKHENTILNRFDKFCIERFPKDTTITPELGLAWATKRDNETLGTLASRVGVIRELARFMNRYEIDAFIIPKGIGRSGNRYTPHIFTTSELCKFFATLDQLQKSHSSPIHHIVYPVLFRLLYSCGLRPNEVICLPCEHVDLRSGVIFIEQAKGRKDRYVALGDDMIALMRNYQNHICQTIDPTIYFFPNSRGTQLNLNNVNRVFRKCWTNAEIPDSYGNAPRVYDFRHSFATKKLHQWNEEGKDLNTYLPYLSSFMGHTHLSATAYYIHLVPEFFPKQEQHLLQACNDLIPEVYDD